MNTFISTLITGTANGAIFALAALGLVIVWRVRELLILRKWGKQCSPPTLHRI